MSPKKPRVPGATTPAEKFVFGIGDIGAAMCFTFMGSFITLYYTDSVGISAAFVGTMMLLVRVFDGFSDIAMGVALEKTNTRFGKVRPWFAVSAVLMGLCVFFTFRVPESYDVGAKETYAAITYGFTAIIAFTIYSVAFPAFLPRISLDQQDRNKTSVIQRFIATVGLLILFAMTPILLEQLGGEKQQSAWSTLTTFYAVGCFVFVFLMFVVIKEKIKPEDEIKKEKIPLGVSLKTVMMNKYFPLLIVIFICNFSAGGVMMGAAPYYCRDVLGDLTIYSIVTIALIVPAVVGYPFAPTIIKRFGKRRSMVIGGIGSVIFMLVCLIDPHNATLFVVMIVLSTLMNVPFNAAIFTLVADLVDYGSYKSGGIRAEGFSGMAASIGTKVGTGLGSAFVGWFLAFGHYNAELATQPQSALTAMILLVIVLRAAITGVSVICLAFWDTEKYSSEFANMLGGNQE